MDNFEYKNNYQSNYFVTKDYSKPKLKKYRDTRTYRQKYLKVIHPDILEAVQGQVSLMLSIIVVISVVFAAIIFHDIQSIQALNL